MNLLDVIYDESHSEFMGVRAQLQHTDWDAVITTMDVIEVIGCTVE